MKLIEHNYETASPDRYQILKDNARANRMCPTDAEYVLWQHLRKKQLGVKFRRQHAINDYIVDFFCLEHMLVVEVDGDYHNMPEQQQEDAQRTEVLTKSGCRILRFSNEDVYNKIDSVLETISNSIIQ